MFDIGWMELLVIGVVALIVVGPEDLPTMFRTAGRFMGRMRGMAREFQRSMEEAADQTGLKEATSGLNKMRDLGLNKPVKSARAYADKMAKDIGKGLDTDLEKDFDKKASTGPAAAADKAEAEADLAEAATEANAAAAAADTPMPDAGMPDMQSEEATPKRAEPADAKPES